MLKKTLMFCTLSTLAFALLTASAFAARGADAGQAEKPDLTVPQTVPAREAAHRFAGGSDEPVGAPGAGWQQESYLGYRGAAAYAYPTLFVDITWYEYQHNGTMGRQIVTAAPDWVYMDYMYLPNVGGARDVRFAQWSPTGTGGTVQTTTVSTAGASGGYCTIDQLYSRALPFWHETAGAPSAFAAIQVSPGVLTFNPKKPTTDINCQGVVTGGT
jgi:hypothetical protein